MNKIKNAASLNDTLNFTRSSCAYKDPYQLAGGMIYKLKNQFYTFNAIRSIENEFVDFKTYSINKNFKAINSDVYTAFNKRDKVRL